MPYVHTNPQNHSSNRQTLSHIQLIRMWAAVLCLIALLAVGISRWLHGWANPKCENGILPPGSMGFPIIGETIEFFSPYFFYDIPPFIKKRMQRYGPVFRTSLVGRKVIVSTDPEINHEIFQQENKSFLIWYTKTFIEVFGQQSLVAHHGMVHKYLKNLILQLVSPENLKGKLLYEIDKATRKHLNSWASLGTIDVKEGSGEMIFEYFAKKLIGYEEETASNKKLRNNFQAFIDGLISFPLNIPGTVYHACLRGRKNACKVIKDIFEKRKASKFPHNDFLDHLLNEVESQDSYLNEQMAIELVFALLFATYETTSAAITLAIKFISDHPKVLEELTKEHEAILRSRDNENSELTWQEYKSMTFTHMVINETVRLANIVPGIFRKVMKDVEMKGYTIPAGWTVMVVPAAVHLSPGKYENPLEFNPWRWEGKELHVGSKTFMAFGGGIRLCVGADFAKLQMAIFIHYIVTKYRWTVMKGGDIARKPGLTFPNGLHIKISEKQAMPRSF
ncbi:cytochrome P450 87A3-like [Durio zibethinus]|uniref:Cytochrome P450 87A3-like n=1 Tax=Durio zibethinus TaxID=66656 RepID=A0A6P5ZXG5_DURZI|nr:cytochrome P450 87A3-like [Durio zibethinus]